MRIAVVGAGISGRLLAWQLCRQGVDVSLFDKGRIAEGEADNFAAAYTAAGMLTPISEADLAEELIVKIGQRSLLKWPAIVEALQRDIDFVQNGSLILAHRADRADMANFCAHLSRYSHLNSATQQLSKPELQQREPDLSSSFNNAVFIPGESCVSTPKLLAALADDLRAKRANLYEGKVIDKLAPYTLVANGSEYRFDRVVDCRGLGAKPDLKTLRAVRGETVYVRAPEVNLRHIIRLMHPRYRIYIVPRADNVYVVGATQIESASTAPITVRSALELLSALYSVHPGFAEASIIQTRVNCRPALPDNLPLIQHTEGLIRINGLFRHGILLAPAIIDTVLSLLSGEDISGVDIPLAPLLNPVGESVGSQLA
ncbi:MAG: glycine oxidase ThiO [Cellvibrionaceae bacterium]|nr:glycine oxidase ThiO [Cellvibrionaceae bacterium]